MKSIERSARANCTAATLRNCGHAQLLLHACGHTCLVSAYMLISHCVNPCTNSKTVHFCSVNECLLHCYFDTYRGICTLVLHYYSVKLRNRFYFIIGSGTDHQRSTHTTTTPRNGIADSTMYNNTIVNNRKKS